MKGTMKRTSPQLWNRLFDKEAATVPLGVVAVMVLVIIVFVAGVVFGIVLEHRAGETRRKAAITAPVTHPVGTAVSGPWTRTTVTAVREETGTNPGFKPSSGNKMMVASVQVQNVSNVVLPFSPLEQMYVADSSNVAHVMASAENTKPLHAASLAPGDTISGDIAFEVPNGSTKNVLHFDPGWQNQAPVLVDLAVSQ